MARTVDKIVDPEAAVLLNVWFVLWVVEEGVNREVVVVYVVVDE